MKTRRITPLLALATSVWIAGDGNDALASSATHGTQCQPGTYGSSSDQIRYYEDAVKNNDSSLSGLVHCPVEVESDSTTAFYVAVHDKNPTSGVRCSVSSYNWSGYLQDYSGTSSTSASYTGETEIYLSTEGTSGSKSHVVSCYLPPKSGSSRSEIKSIYAY